MKPTKIKLQMKSIIILALLALLTVTGCQKNASENQSGASTTPASPAPSSPGNVTTNTPPATSPANTNSGSLNQ